MKEACIPFSGFYDSEHISLLDDTLEQEFMDDNGMVNEELLDMANGAVVWKDAKLAYAKVYTEYLSDFMRDYWVKEGRLRPLWTFKEIISPREYNFTTDRIFVNISANVLKMMRKAIDPGALEKQTAEHMTSRSGFHSRYNPDPKTWGPMADWDCNQNGMVVYAYIQQFGNIYDGWVWGLMECAVGNGVISNLLWAAIPDDKRAPLDDAYAKWRYPHEHTKESHEPAQQPA